MKPYLSASVLGRAVRRKIIAVRTYDIRQWAHDKHRRVDDVPYGGGPGMVMKIEPIHEAVESIKLKVKKAAARNTKKPRVRVVLFSTRGKLFTSAEAKRLLRYDHLIFICGRYEGVDERVARYVADEEISVGSFVLSGGEIPALVVVDTVARMVKGVLGKHESLEEVKGSYAVYTRPPVYRSSGRSRKQWTVPSVLLSGNHADIKRWRARYDRKNL